MPQAPERMGAVWNRIRPPMAGLPSHFDVPARHIEPIICPRKDQPQAIPALGGAHFDAVEVKALPGFVLLVLVRFLAGKPLPIGGDNRAPGLVDQTRRDQQEPRIGVNPVGVDDLASRIRSPLGFLAIPHRPVQLSRTWFPQ